MVPGGGCVCSHPAPSEAEVPAAGPRAAGQSPEHQLLRGGQRRNIGGCFFCSEENGGGGERGEEGEEGGGGEEARNPRP